MLVVARRPRRAGRRSACRRRDRCRRALLSSTIAGKLIVPGFIDTHVHYAQTDIIASYGEQLLEWLERYTFPTERLFQDPAHAREVADVLPRPSCCATARRRRAVFATVHPESVDAIFAAARERGMCIVAGKVLMDRNCPEFLRDTAESGYEQSAALIERWHGRDRLLYAVTPRFAPTSTDRQLELAGLLLDEHAGVLLQSHVAENRDEVRWVAELFPWSRSYLDVYDHFGLLAPGRRLRALHPSGRRRTASGWRRRARRCRSVRRRISFSAAASSISTRRERTGSRSASAPTSAAARAFRCCARWTRATRSRSSRDSGCRRLPRSTWRRSAERGRWDSTIASATSRPASAADFVVLDPAATPLMARRMARAQGLVEELFVLMMLGDDRAIAATYVMGEERYRRAS